MNKTQASYRESLQDAIDIEIKSLEKSVQLLKLRRNALQPISSFPPEIFTVIFSFLCLPGMPSLLVNLAQNRARLSISHVCHQWREIALNQPLLWSHVNFNTTSSAGATEMLARAQSVPLYMEIGVSGGHRFDLFLREVQARLPRIRHLSIGADIYQFYRGLKSALESPAPSLEYLSLFCQEDEDDTEDLRMARQYLSESVPGIKILDTLFASTPRRLSCLKLRNCNISWNSPLFKGIKSLSIDTPFDTDRPTLAVWLDALGDIPQLQTLTLHTASPVATHFPFDVERTVTLPSLTRLDILASLRDCALAIAHLDLPALTSLCLTELDHFPRNTGTGRVQEVLPYVAKHVHGPQDIRPLQSVLIHNSGDTDNLHLLAWSVLDIDTLVHDPPAILGATLPTRVNLCFRGGSFGGLEIFEMTMAALPLDGLLTLVAVDLNVCDSQGHRNISYFSQFWLRRLPNWPLLRRVRLGPYTLQGFIQALLEDCKNPLLPSLTELALARTRPHADLTLCLCDMTMKRVEEGVPLETLDLRMCYRHSYDPVRLLSEIVVDVRLPLYIFDPDDTEDDEGWRAGREMFDEMASLWEHFHRYPYGDGLEDEENEDDDN